MIQRIQSDDPDFRMPPGERTPLNLAQINLFKRWIDQGAIYGGDSAAPDNPQTVPAEKMPQHWAYIAPTRPTPPGGDGLELAHPIDRFIGKRLAQADLAPAPLAERHTLARRLSLDLTGLPLDEKQLATYEADMEPGAYARLVDRLLASPHFGERWGRHWLDLARYSDSDGGGLDVKRSMWPYREWVIHAINADMPFDRFSIEQIAGDLLPHATRDQRVATGFFRNTTIQQEGGADDEEFRIEAVKQRVQMSGEVWMGTTMICAQCHDHKFDPISQRDYYQLFALFNQTKDTGRSNDPLLDLPSEPEARELERIDIQLRQLDERLAEQASKSAESQGHWEKGYLARQPKWEPLEIQGLTASHGVELTEEPDGSVYVSGASPPRAWYAIEGASPFRRISAIRLQVLPDDRLPYGGPGRGFKGQFVLTKLSLSYKTNESSTAHDVLLSAVSADRAGEFYPVEAALDGQINSGWGFNNRTGTPHEAIFQLEHVLEVPDPGKMALSIRLEHGADLQRTLGRFKLFVTDAPDPPSPRPYDFDIEAVLRKSPDQRGPAEAAALEKHYLRVSPQRKALSRERARLIAQRPVPATTLVMQATEEPRKSHVHLRGNFLSLGAVVEGGTPAAFPKLRTEQGPMDRLGFAQWLMHPQNPLTARVTVNRWWQRLFGVGLVETSGDLGTRSSPPSHPELLDWLAVELIESGWSLKSMLRTIVSSEAYRRSSTPSQKASQVDPHNRLLSHQARLRLEGEQVRDCALSASGVLDPSIGGASVYPPQPSFLSVRLQPEDWPLSPGQDRFRRGLYTWHWRTSPYPFLALFDGPDGTTSCTRRGQSNNALQALAMANDPMMFELAQELARRIVNLGDTSTKSSIKRAFGWCFGRVPTEKELNTLNLYYDSQLTSFQADQEATRQASPNGMESPRAAAFTALARVLFNLDEFITRR